MTVSTTVPALLHICEPATPGANDPACLGGDDTGADELILELDEQLLPGGPYAAWDFTLKNLSADVVWDITSAAVAWTETIDPGNDCVSSPTYQIYTHTSDDDHRNSSSGPLFPTLAGIGGNYVVHVAQNAADDMQIRVWLPGSFPIECKGNAWDLSIVWTAEVH